MKQMNFALTKFMCKLQQHQNRIQAVLVKFHVKESGFLPQISSLKLFRATHQALGPPGPKNTDSEARKLALPKSIGLF